MSLPKDLKFSFKEIQKSKRKAPIRFVTMEEFNKAFIILEEKIPEAVKGDQGERGFTGKGGINGKDGISIEGRVGRDGRDGRDGVDGERGLDGKNGKNGLVASIKSVIKMFEDFKEEIKAELRKRKSSRQVGGGGGGSIKFITVTGDITIPVNAGVVLVDASSGPVTVTLPSATLAARKEYHVKKIDSSGNAVTIATSGSETIDDGATAVIANQYESVRLYSDNSNFHVI